MNMRPRPTGWNAIAEALATEARRTPERMAVSDATGTLTYAAFDERVGSIAGELLDRLDDRLDHEATTAHPVVPVLVGRDRHSAVVVHAAIRAGVALGPLDIALPTAELHRRWERLGCSPVVLVGPEGATVELPAGVTAIGSSRSRPIRPDQPIQPRQSVPDHHARPGQTALGLAGPSPAAQPELAAVVFSSGSTGRAKGVLLGQDVIDAIAQVATVLGPLRTGTDLTVSSLVHIGGFRRTLNIAFGRPLAIIDPALLTADALLDRIAATDITDLTLVTAVARLLAGASGRRRLDSVQTVRIAGEPVDWAWLPGILRQIAPGGTVIHSYNASEAATAGAFEFRVSEDQPVGTGTLPLGVPLSTDRVRLEPVGDPADALVELVVRGTVAFGYLGDPEETAKRFGVDPDGTRFWRSGDLLAALPQGGYRFAGRADDLVKINGRLAEPAVTRTALLALPDVRMAAVLPETGPNGSDRLVAHLEIDPGATITASEVFAALRLELPGHQVPAVLVRHDRLPHTANIKLDRRKLLTDPYEPWRDDSYVAPVDPLESFVLEQCAAALGMSELGMDSDLWLLGLDSIAAVELAAAIGSTTWYGLQPDELLSATTPGRIAARLRNAVEPSGSEVTVLNAAGTKPPLFCLPGAGGTALRFGWLATGLGPDQPVHVIAARGTHTDLTVDRSVEAAATSALAVLRETRPSGPVVLAGHSAGGVIAYEVAQRLRRDGRQVDVIVFDSLHRRLARQEAMATRTLPERLWARRPSALLRGVRRRADRRAALRGLGAPTGTPERYRAMYTLGRGAVARYTPLPATFPVVLYQATGSSAARVWQRLVPDLRVVDCDGDHLSMLEPPHVERLATDLAARLAQLGRTPDTAA